MPISSSDIASLTDYSFAEIKKAAKAAMINCALGGTTLTINGRTLQRVTLDDARRLYQWAEQMESEGDANGGRALITFENPNA